VFIVEPVLFMHSKCVHRPGGLLSYHLAPVLFDAQQAVRLEQTLHSVSTHSANTLSLSYCLISRGDTLRNESQEAAWLGMTFDMRGDVDDGWSGREGCFRVR
jgi:hypothetical protein